MIGARILPLRVSPSSVVCHSCGSDNKATFEIRSEITASRLFWACVLGAFAMSLGGMFSSLPLMLGTGSVLMGSAIVGLIFGGFFGMLAYFFLGVPLQLLID